MKRMTIMVLVTGMFLATCGLIFAQDASDLVTRPQYIGSGNKDLDPLYKWAYWIQNQVTADTASSAGARTWYVDYGVTNEGDGTTWEKAFDTLQEAIDASDADGGDNRGDLIRLATSHAENVASAAAITVDVAGITIEGCGSGDEMAEFSLTAQLSTFAVTVADVTLKNLRFLGNYTNGVTQCLDIAATGDGCRVLGCEFRETANTKELLIMITVTADADRCVIVGNTFIGLSGGSDSVAVNMEGGCDNGLVAGNVFIGDWSGYVVDGTTAASISLTVLDNYVVNEDAAAGKTLAFHASTTGVVAGNHCYGNGASHAFVGDAMFVSPDNVFTNQENVETATYFDMLGAFTGPAAGTAQAQNVKASLDLAHTDLDAILADTALVDTEAEFGAFGSVLVDNIVAAMDVNGLLVNWTAARAAIVTDLAGISQLGDKVVADMDANSVPLAILTDLQGISQLGDKIVADMDANSVLADLAGISQIGDKIVADMDANSILADLAGISQVGDKVAADIDVNSLLYYQPHVSTASADEVTQDLFAVAGGAIEIISFYGLVDVDIGANATTCKIWADATAGAAWDVDFSTAVNIEGDTAGQRYVFTSANPSVLTPLANAAAGGTQFTKTWYCPVGMIEQLMSADPGGAAGDHITWFMVWRPLLPGVTVTAQ